MTNKPPKKIQVGILIRWTFITFSVQNPKNPKNKNIKKRKARVFCDSFCSTCTTYSRERWAVQELPTRERLRSTQDTVTGTRKEHRCCVCVYVWFDIHTNKLFLTSVFLWTIYIYSHLRCWFVDSARYLDDAQSGLFLSVRYVTL